MLQQVAPAYHDASGAHLLQKLALYLLTNATVITEVQCIGKLEAASYTLQQVIAYDPDANSWLHFLGDSQKLFVVYGNVTAGIDLSKLSSSDIQIQGKELGKASVTFNAPASQILTSAVDPSRTRLYDANSGISAFRFTSILVKVEF